MPPNMSSGISHVSACDEKCPTTAPPQEEYTDHIWDESEPEVASESDGDDDIFFKPSPSPPPNVIKRTLRELKDLMNTPYLDLNSPEHRPRRYEGSSEDLISIIDSLSQNHEFPPIFFNQKQVRGSDGSIQYSRVCIDGLKRLSAIKAFMDGEIPCHDHRRRKWFYCIKNDLEARAVGGRRILPMDDKEDFQNKHFVCHEFEDLTGSEEIELRARVHLGSILTPGEKLRAAMVFSGELMIDFAKTLERDFQHIADLADTRRMKGFQNLMKCSSQIFEIQRARAENRVPILRISDTALNDFIKHADASALEKIRKTLGVFGILVTRHPEVFHSILGVPFRPMEMIIIAVLAFKYYETNVRPIRFIHFIASLRESTHKFSRHQGVLQTRRIWNYAWNSIENIENYVIEGEVSDLEQEVRLIGSLSSLSQSTAVKRKASPHPLDLAKKRVQQPTPVSPAILQSPRMSLRAGSPDSLLGSGDSEGEHVAETTGGTIQEELPAQKISPVPASRQLIRSSFKSRSELVPHRSESPKGNTILFGASQRPAAKSSLLYSHETKKTISYQSSYSNETLPSEEPSSQSGGSHVTPINQGHLEGYKIPTVPPYSGRGRPRKYPPKSATPEGQTPRKRGRPRKDSSSVVPDTPRIQASDTRGRGRERKGIPGGVSTRAPPTSPPAIELDTASPMLRQNGGWAVNTEQSDGDICYDQPLEGQSSAASTDPKQAPAPAKPPAPPAPPAAPAAPPAPPTPPTPRAQPMMQSRAISISSSREPSISCLSNVGSLSTMSPRTTPDLSLVDAKAFVASFKAGGANAIRERRRQQQAELEEKKRRKQEAAKSTNSATVSVTPKD